jgi:hypothetical protein
MTGKLEFIPGQESAWRKFAGNDQRWVTVPVFLLRRSSRKRAVLLLSVALGHYVSPYWYLFTAFVGLNLFQSGFTNWCPMMTFLRKLGVGR